MDQMNSSPARAKAFSGAQCSISDNAFRKILFTPTAAFPLSAALFASCSLKRQLPTRIYSKGKLVAFRNHPDQRMQQPLVWD